MDSNSVAIGIYCDSRVVAWEVGSQPPVVVYEGNGSLMLAWTHLQNQGYRVVLILDELKGKRGVSLLMLKGERWDPSTG